MKRFAPPHADRDSPGPFSGGGCTPTQGDANVTHTTEDLGNENNGVATVATPARYLTGDPRPPRGSKIGAVAGLLAAGLLATSAVGCSPAPPSRHGVSSHSAIPATRTQLAALPDPSLMGGHNDMVLVAASGRGEKKLGTFKVTKGGQIYVQVACDGPAPLTVLPLMDAGPCTDPRVVIAEGLKSPASEITLTVRASPRMRWTVYIAVPYRILQRSVKAR